jgi:hypothetical protein
VGVDGEDVGVVIGTGTEWPEAVDNIAWESGEMLLLGFGAAGPMAQGVPRLCCLENPAPRTCPGHDHPRHHTPLKGDNHGVR